MERPLLTLELAGPEGNVFVVIERARELLTGLRQEQFNTDIEQATLLSQDTTYKDILAIVNRYVRLIDRSRLYPDYVVSKEEVTAAVDHLNEQLQALDAAIYCSLQGLYPDFDDPDCNEYVYLTMLQLEIMSVDEQIKQGGDEEPLQRLLEVLQACVSAFARAGIE